MLYLEILFENRNKAYGAYQIRKGYNKRLTISLLTTLFITLIISSFGFNSSSSSNIEIQVKDITLVNIPDKKEKVVEIVKPKEVKPPEVRSVRSTTILIVKDNMATDDVKPPEVEEINNSKIGLIKTDGDIDDGVVIPPVESKGTGETIDITPKKQDYDTIFTKVETPAEFPGGVAGWSRYLDRNLKYPEKAIDNSIQGVVKLQFVIDREGNISDIVVLQDPGYGLSEESIRIIRKSPKWIPAEQNGRKVIYRTTQSISFILE